MASLNAPYAASAERTASSADHWQAVAVRALGFVADDRSECDRFLAGAGMSRADLQRRPVATTHLAAVLDFLVTNESALQKFVRKVDISMEAAYEARRRWRQLAARG
jgi:hypothetical protein